MHIPAGDRESCRRYAPRHTHYVRVTGRGFLQGKFGCAGYCTETMKAAKLAVAVTYQTAQHRNSHTPPQPIRFAHPSHSSARPEQPAAPARATAVPKSESDSLVYFVTTRRLPCRARAVHSDSRLRNAPVTRASLRPARRSGARCAAHRRADPARTNRVDQQLRIPRVERVGEGVKPRFRDAVGQVCRVDALRELPGPAGGGDDSRPTTPGRQRSRPPSESCSSPFMGRARRERRKR